MSPTANLLATFEVLAAKHGVSVAVDPPEYEIKAPCAIDIEHDEQGNLVGIGVYDGKAGYYFTTISRRLVSVLCSLSFIAHNGKSDMEQLRAWGIPVLESQLVWDTMLMGHIIDSSLKSYGLKAMAKRELAIEYPEYDAIVGKHKGKTTKAPKCPQTEPGCCERVTLDKQSVRLVSLYNGFDTVCTFKLYEKQLKRCEKDREIRYFDELEKPASGVFANMETRGTCIDVPYLKDLKVNLEDQIEPVKSRIFATLGDINLNSPKQLIGALNEHKIYPSLKGKPSTDKKALASLASQPVVRDLLQYSEIETLLCNFVTPYLERNTSVVHPFFNQCGTRTGRPSCSNPNLLQIPKRTDKGKALRRMFKARDGMLMGDCDYGQIEPRVLAHLSKDPVLCQMFNDGVDFHTFTADRLSISRDRAKVLNLSVGYKAGKWSVQRQLGGTLDEAQKQIDAWWSLFPVLRRWQESLIWASKRSGFVSTLLGRRIKVDGLDSNNSWKREAAERQVINNVTQGSAAEIMKLAMIKINNMDCFTPGFGLLVQIYDELLFESPKVDVDIHNVVWAMEKATTLDVPLVVDGGIGPNWADIQ